ncbi:clavaminic acid synthetase (CAS)-like superfamily protein [Emydomyces testavorans]|uniref:Clavaminic acid synthetase (CAS)-like superfamily protein n=1 Tax=Emydomyces testavorans TaxID=2070801 RepID=A0AAF0IEG7_9EURO|nr:clavaminic acid synthetase (CAS)-like superfamily protein [Emydomyces testavorans]
MASGHTDNDQIPLDIRARDIRTDSERGVIIQYLEFVPDDPSAFPTVDYNEVMASDDGVREWTRKIYLYGFCFVKGCPVEPKATEKLLERIAFIRRTHYGRNPEVHVIRTRHTD